MNSFLGRWFWLKSMAVGLMAFFVGPAHSSQEKVQDKLLKLPHQEFRLKNGLRVFLVKFPSPGVVAYQLPVRVGSRNEVEKGKTGFAHFFEHLMFRGTKNRSGKEFGDLYTRLGAENNAWTDNDMTNYHGVVAKKYLPQILEAEADRFRNLSFDEKLLKDEAGAVMGEYMKNISQPEAVLEEKLAEAAFKVHPYGHTTMGYREDIQKFSERYKDVWVFFERYYRPSNVSVVLVGDVDFAKSRQLIEKYFGKWKNPQTAQALIASEPEQAEARKVESRLGQKAQTRITVAYKIPGFSTRTPDIAAIELLSEMFFSKTSDFQNQFRFEKKWVDVVYTGRAEWIDPYVWTINLRLSALGEGKEAELLTAIQTTVRGIASQQVSQDRLGETKKRFRNAALSSWFKSPSDLADRIAWYSNLEPDQGIKALDAHFAQLAKVTPAHIQAVAKKHLVDSKMTTVILRGQ
ncbi:MAG: pitrilysin family protein [Bdellovibrionota bacterium]